MDSENNKNSLKFRETHGRTEVPWRELFSVRNQQVDGPHYVEFGKVFHEYGATDWMSLDYSDSDIRGYARDFFFTEFGLKETQSPFVRGSDPKGVGKVSIAFKALNEQDKIKGFVYAQLQQRREGEFSHSPRTDRRYIQARFVYLIEEEIIKILSGGFSLYTSLLYNAPRLENTIGRWGLKDYAKAGKPVAWPINLIPLELDTLDGDLVENIVDALLASSRPVDGSSRFVRSPEPIVIAVPGLSILEKLKIIDAVQYYVYSVLGVITFALDYVTDRSVLLRFYDNPSSMRSEKNVYTHENSLSDYFITVSKQYPEFLLNDNFISFLRKGYSAQKAARRTKLSVKNFDEYDIDEWVSHITEFVAEIDSNPKERDLIYDRIDGDKFEWLLKLDNTSQELTCSLLRYRLEKTRGNLVLFLKYYLAIPEAKRRYTKVIQIFQEAVYYGSPDSLSQLPENDQETVYKEFLLNRYLITDGEVTTKPLFFSPDQMQEILTFKILLQLPGQNLFKAIRFVLENDAQFIGDLVDHLKSVIPNWDYEQVVSFWKSLNLNDFRIYETLLAILLRHNLPKLIEHPKQFRQFLELGRDVCRNQPSSNQQPLGHFEEQTQNGKPAVHLMSHLEQNIQNSLRETCIKISDPSKKANLQFSEWWIFTELGYADDEIIQKDMRQLVTLYSSNNVDPEMAITAEFKYLVSQGKLRLVSSLRSACRECNGDLKHLLNTTNQNLFNAVSSIWVERGISLLPDDLMLMIDELPKSNELLAGIIYDDRQKDTVASLKSDYALIWLEKTSGVLRQQYFKNGEDYLCKRLLVLEKPDSVFIWQMIVEEDGTYPPTMEWDEYIRLCQSAQAGLESNEINISDDLKNYFDLANVLRDPRKLGLLNRVMLKLFVNKIIRDEFPEIADFNDQKLKALYIYYDPQEKNNYSPKIKKFARAFLIYYLAEQNLSERIGKLTEDTRKALRAFVTYEKDALSESVMQTLGVRDSKEKLEEIKATAKTFHTAAQTNLPVENDQIIDKQKDTNDIGDRIEIVEIKDDSVLDLGGPLSSVKQTDSQTNQQSPSYKLMSALYIMVIIAAIIASIVILFIIVDFFTGLISSWIIEKIQ